MALWKSGEFIANEWRMLADDVAPPRGVKVLIALGRWRAERAELIDHSAPLGLVLAPDSLWSDISGDLERFQVIALTFPKFADGRAFSIARLRG